MGPTTNLAKGMDDNAADDITFNTTTVAVVVGILCFVVVFGCFVAIRGCWISKNAITGDDIEMGRAEVVNEGPVIRNGLVVGIAIGKYDSDSFMNLEVGKDLDNLTKFSDSMGYKFISNDGKTHWTKEEILSYLRDDVGAAFFTNSGRPKYDGLLVCVSGHGVRGHVVTSELERVDKTEMYRCICEKYPKFVDTPRVFIFDCCAGARERRYSRSVQIKEEEVTGKEKAENTQQHIVAVHSDELSGEFLANGDIGKTTDLGAIDELKEDSISKMDTNMDLDRNIAVVHAANAGYQAKMRSFGSYLLYSFIYYVQDNDAKHEQKGLEELIEKIQNGLHGIGRQQTESVFYDTKYLRMEREVVMEKPF